MAWWCSSGGSELLADTLTGCERSLLEERLLALKGKSWIGALRWQHLRRLADLRGRVCSDLLLQELILEELLLLLGRGRVEEEGLLAGGPWVGGVEATALSIVWIHSVLYFVIVDISQCVSFRVLECTFDFFFINDYTSSFISKSVNTVLASSETSARKTDSEAGARLRNALNYTELSLSRPMSLLNPLKWSKKRFKAFLA